MKITVPIRGRLLLRDGALLAGTVAFLALWLAGGISARVLWPVTSATTAITVLALNALGLQVGSHGAVVYDQSGFAYTISYRCTGLLLVTLWCLLVASVHCVARWRHLVWLCAGACALYALNLVRLVSLFLLAVYAPALFEVAHRVLWELVLMITLGILYLSFSDKQWIARWRAMMERWTEGIREVKEVAAADAREISKMHPGSLGKRENWK